MGNVQYATVLDVGTRTDRHAIDVAANSGHRPNADILTEGDKADDHAAGIDYDPLAELGGSTSVRTQRFNVL